MTIMNRIVPFLFLFVFLCGFALNAAADSSLDPYIAKVSAEHKADLKYINEENLIKLAKLKRDYTISMHFDGVNYRNDVYIAYIDLLCWCRPKNTTKGCRS